RPAQALRAGRLSAPAGGGAERCGLAPLPRPAAGRRRLPARARTPADGTGLPTGAGGRYRRPAPVRAAVAGAPSMLSLDQPWALMLLPLPLIVRWLLPALTTSQPALAVPFFARLEAAGATASRRRRSPWWRWLLASLIWLS